MKTAIKAMVVLSGLLGTTSAAAAATPPLFGTVEFRVDSLAALPQWRHVLRQIERERRVYRLCAAGAEACPTRSAIAWQAMLKEQAGRPPLEQLEAVNQFLNQWQYRTDEQNYGQRDHWATPLEFLRRSGDCEDYAIAKYVSLRQLGFAVDDLRLVVLRDVVRDLPHAVLAVYQGDEVYILDNLTSAILPQAQLRQYVPYYSINEAARWAHVAPADTMVSTASGLSPGDAGD